MSNDLYKIPNKASVLADALSTCSRRCDRGAWQVPASRPRWLLTCCALLIILAGTLYAIDAQERSSEPMRQSMLSPSISTRRPSDETANLAHHDAGGGAVHSINIGHSPTVGEHHRDACLTYESTRWLELPCWGEVLSTAPT